MLNKKSPILVFDVESVGLHGEAFQVGACFFNGGQLVYEFKFEAPIEQQDRIGEDYKWVKENVSQGFISALSYRDLRNLFWSRLLMLREQFGAISIFAECLWPVEGRFFNKCIEDDLKNRKFSGPYPFFDVSSFMAAAGMDPMANYPRLEKELPQHCPLADSRQSARLLFEAFEKLNLTA